MASVFDMLIKQMGGEVTKQISKQLGASENTTKNAMPKVVGLLLGALANNTRRPGGAEALNDALTEDHDGGILDDIGGFLDDFKQGEGDGILGHVLGDKRGAVEQKLSSDTGLDIGSIANLLTMVAPMVLGLLGKTQRQSGLDAEGLAGLLQTERSRALQSAPQSANILSQLLDADGDGDVKDDVAKMGLGFLSRLFRRGN
jgi:hypothetical protein